MMARGGSRHAADVVLGVALPMFSVPFWASLCPFFVAPTWARIEHRPAALAPTSLAAISTTAGWTATSSPSGSTHDVDAPEHEKCVKSTAKRPACASPR